MINTIILDIVKRVFALLIGLILSLIASSQSCLPLGITFHNQGQIDSFQVNYPGCMVIEGDVFIGDYGGGSNITDLTGLSVLNSVGGNFIIRYNENLTSLEGLDNLATIGNGLSIEFNDALENIIDITGKQLIQRRITEQQTVVDVSGLLQGVYFVRLTNDMTVQVGKIIKH